ncbi:MAG: cyclic nucleotide-binding domain-containing protein [Gammaproteobacteria bacterium]|nr:cyclic nucleotide-binding domain-containing protein [Gammaproteobacteria bacterium]MBU1416643.1 cyclic nucleotide-binding domain-containing protein [Gammaproteobacteria bacterium]
MNSNAPTLYPELEYLGSATRFIEEILQLIDQIPFFGGFSDQEIQALTGYMGCYGAPRKARLLTEGQTDSHMLLLLTGRAAVLKNDSQGVEKIVAEAGPGTTLGEMSMIDVSPRSASCVTTEPTDFAVLTRGSLNEIFINSPRLGNKLLLVLLQLTMRRLREANDRLLLHATDRFL